MRRGNQHVFAPYCSFSSPSTTPFHSKLLFRQHVFLCAGPVGGPVDTGCAWQQAGGRHAATTGDDEAPRPVGGRARILGGAAPQSPTQRRQREAARIHRPLQLVALHARRPLLQRPLVAQEVHRALDRVARDPARPRPIRAPALPAAEEAGRRQTRRHRTWRSEPGQEKNPAAQQRSMKRPAACRRASTVRAPDFREDLQLGLRLGDAGGEREQGHGGRLGAGVADAAVRARDAAAHLRRGAAEGICAVRRPSISTPL